MIADERLRESFDESGVGAFTLEEGGQQAGVHG